MESMNIQLGCVTAAKSILDELLIDKKAIENRALRDLRSVIRNRNDFSRNRSSHLPCRSTGRAHSNDGHSNEAARMLCKKLEKYELALAYLATLSLFK